MDVSYYGSGPVLSVSHAISYLTCIILLYIIININLSMSIKILFVILHISSQAKTNYFRNCLILTIMLAWVPRPLNSILFFLDGKTFNKSYIIKCEFGSKFKKT